MGYADPENSRIIVYAKNLSTREIISTILHEIQHVLMWRNGKYVIYNAGLNSTASRKTFNIWKNQLLKCELLADKMAETMMKKTFPNLKYKPAYAGNKKIKQHTNAYIAMAEEYLFGEK